MAKKAVDRFVRDANTYVESEPLARFTNLLRDKHFTSDVPCLVTESQSTKTQAMRIPTFGYPLVSSQH